MELKLNEAEVQKLNLQPGEVLVIKVKSDDLDGYDIARLSDGLKNFFPNNKVLVMGVSVDGAIDLTIAKGSEYPETQYCQDCNCGKKAAFEGT